MSAAGEASRRPESGKRSGAPAGKRRSRGRSIPAPLVALLVLFDNHDELIEAKGWAGSEFHGKPCVRVFAALELTLAAGASRHPGRAPQDLVARAKEKARLAGPEAKADAEGAFQRVHDPRRNMPSRFTGSFPAPLSDRQPARLDARPLPPPPAMAAEVGSELTVMPGGPVLTGGPEELLPASEFTVMFDGKPLDLRLFIGPEDPRPWDLPEFSDEEKIRVMKVHLKLRFESWRRERGGSRSNRVDREWRKRLGKS